MKNIACLCLISPEWRLLLTPRRVCALVVSDTGVTTSLILQAMASS